MLLGSELRAVADALQLDPEAEASDVVTAFNVSLVRGKVVVEAVRALGGEAETGNLREEVVLGVHRALKEAGANV